MEVVMFKHTGGETVKGGFYWNRATWRLENVEGKTGTLPGDAETRYAHVPTLLMLVLAPVMGGLFVVFLPFIGFALLLGMVVNSVRHHASWMTPRRIANSVRSVRL
jgi:hypothetical protein